MRHEKPELSPKNPYHLSRHRYYELKHFCFQYKEWKKALVLLDGWQSHGDEVGGIVKGNMQRILLVQRKNDPVRKASQKAGKDIRDQPEEAAGVYTGAQRIR